MNNPGAPYPGNNPNMGPQPPPPVVVVNAMRPTLGHDPATITCPHCNNHVTTNVQYDNSNKTHVSALVLCLLCGCLPGIIPYCCNSCKTATHTCPVCRQNLGTHDG